MASVLKAKVPTKWLKDSSTNTENISQNPMHS